MIGPRPTRDRGSNTRPAISSTSRAPPKSRVKSRSRSRNVKKTKEKEKDKDSKEFAWMDSGDESEKSAKSSASSAARKPVPLDRVQTLGEMARLAPDIEKRLRHGDVRSRELVEVATALARSKFFDAGLLEALHDELARACRKGNLGREEIVTALCDLAEINSYNAKLFEEACSALANELERLPDTDRRRLEAALRRVDHDPGKKFYDALREPRRTSSGKEACPMFFRGQCKWGPKCKLSHDDAAFDKIISTGEWKPPSSSGGKSVGYRQSSDLFKADRCGALW